jgi:hypothetical protein
MNKIHRTVWSEARQCFVVASETAKAKGKASSTRTATTQAVVAALLALSAGQALALDPLSTDLCTTTGTTLIDSPITGFNNCVLANGEAVSISGIGSFYVTSTRGENYPIKVLTGTTAAGSIVNSGSITVTNLASAAVDIQGVTDSFLNEGTIQGGTNAGGVSISQGKITNNFNNTGRLAARIALAVDFQGTITGQLINSGVIAGLTKGVSVASTALIVGSLTNSGTISGSQKGIFVRGSILSNGLTNSGRIGDGLTGIHVLANGNLTGGLTNSGTIAGTNFAVKADTGTATGTISGISIEGNAAKFVGAVSVPNTMVEVISAAAYTMDNGQQFTVSGFTNAGTLKIGAGSTGTITGTYTNAGTFSPTAGSTSSFGKLSVAGTATIPANMAFDVVFSDTAACAGLTAGGTLAGVISATTLAVTGGTLSGTVTHNCGSAITISAVNTGTAVNLVAQAAPPSYTITTTASPLAGGSISCSPNPVTSGSSSTCTPIAATGYTFSAFSGDCSGATCTISNVNSAKSVTATFAASSVAGQCGPANGVASLIRPVAQNLCTTGTTSGLAAANGGFAWNCVGSGGGATAQCVAPGVTATGNTGSVTGSVTFELTDDGGCRINSLGLDNSLQGGPGNGVVMPFGVVQFELVDCTRNSVTAKTTYSSSVASMQFYKYMSRRGGWINVPGTDYTLSPDGYSITLTITDNGPYDNDLTNSVIVDPGGPGYLPSATDPQSIPTLSEWGLIALTGLMGLFGLRQMRRRG